MKPSFLFALSATMGEAACLCASAQAQDHHEMSAMPAATTIHSTARIVTIREWGERVQKLLDKELRYPEPMAGAPVPTGIVRVKFNCSDTGRPDQVTLLKKSGYSALDREAVRAVSRIVSLHPLPSGFKPDQHYEAAIVFAADQQDTRLKQIAVERTKRNGWYHDPAALAARGSIIAPMN